MDNDNDLLTEGLSENEASFDTSKMKNKDVTRKDGMHMELYEANTTEEVQSDFQFALAGEIKFPAIFGTTEVALSKQNIIMFLGNRDIAAGEYNFYCIHAGNVHALGTIDFTPDAMYHAKRFLNISSFAKKESAEASPCLITEDDIILRIKLNSDQREVFMAGNPQELTPEEVREAIEEQTVRRAVSVTGTEDVKEEQIKWLAKNS